MRGYFPLCLRTLAVSTSLEGEVFWEQLLVGGGAGSNYGGLRDGRATGVGGYNHIVNHKKPPLAQICGTK